MVFEDENYTDEEWVVLFEAQGKLETTFGIKGNNRDYFWLWERVEIGIRNGVIYVIINDVEFAKEHYDRFPSEELIAKMRLALL